MRLLLVVLLFLLLPGCAATAAVGTPEGDTLSVVTLNIWHNRGDWPRRADYMVRALGELRPDVIVLQEVLQNPELPNQAETLAARLGGYLVYFASPDTAGSPKRYGNAILSRLPVLDTGWTRLAPREHYRVAAHVRVALDGTPVDVYGTHLHYSGEAPSEEGSRIRCEQLADLLRFVRETASGGPVVVAGDFNTRPDDPALRVLEPRLRDAYAALHPAENAGPAHTTVNPAMFENLRRIDYLYYSPASLRPVSAEIILDEPGPGGVWASDHFGVFVRFLVE